MLEANPQGLTGVDVEVLADGVPLATIDGSLWNHTGSILVDGAEFRFHNDGLTRMTLILDGNLVAEATHHLVHRTWTVTFGDRSLVLRPVNIWGRAYDVLESDVTVGEVNPKGLMIRGLTATLPDGIPHAVQVFIVYVVLTAWGRRDSTIDPH